MISPEAISPSGEEMERNSGKEKETLRSSIKLRKSSEIRKKACLNPKILEAAGDSLSAESGRKLRKGTRRF